MKYLLYFFIFCSLTFGDDRPIVMLIGGIHGDEVSGVVLLKELLLKPYSLKKGSLFIISEANEKAVAENKRTLYYMDDLNRAFPGSMATSTEKIAYDIFETIKKIKPDFIVDFHESYYNFDESKDPNFYIGNSIIANKNALDKMMDFLIDTDLPLSSTPFKGSLIAELDSLEIPGIVLETSREENLEKRVQRGKDLLINIFNYFEMGLEQ